MEPDTKKPRLDGLLERIVSSTPVQGKGLADPKELYLLPFPSAGIIPERFSVRPDRRFTFMGRTGYAEFVEKVLCLSPAFPSYELKELPVGPEKGSHSPLQIVNLWGTMGSGKSYMLAALACDLLARFSSTRRSGDIQRQRVCYIPDCQLLVQSPRMKLTAVRHALGLAYADDDELLSRVDSISDDASAIAFFEEEAKRGVLIYLLVDQVNAFENSQKDGPAQQQVKCDVCLFLHSLGSLHVIVKSASANNNNAQEWDRKQLNQGVMFHHGGLDDEEYASWKIHFSVFGDQPTPLAKLTEDDELRVKDATGCVPLFLRWWSNSHDNPSDAWKQFIKSPEIRTASVYLPKYIINQLDNEGRNFQPYLLDMYLQFMTRGDVRTAPDLFDCRYLYLDPSSGTGRYVCGVYRDLIAQTLQMYRKSVISPGQWQTVISHEVVKENPNPSVLGFMIEQEMISEILQNGVPLYGKNIMKCESICYFKSGQEAHLPIREGCVLYVPDAFNYGRVDAIIRQYTVCRKEVYDGTCPPDPKDLPEIYHELQLQVAGLQITLGSLARHLNSETQFSSPETLKVWCPNKDLKDVGKWFIWYVLQSEMDNLTRDAEDLAPFLFGHKRITGKTRATRIQEVDHVTRFYALEDYEPKLKSWRK